MLDSEKSGQHVAVEHRRYCEGHPNPAPGTEVRDHSLRTMTFVADKFAGEIPDVGGDECKCGRKLDSEVRVLSWPPTHMTGEAITEYLARTNGLFAIETAGFSGTVEPANAPAWGEILPLDSVPAGDECLQAAVIDGYLVTANSYTGDPVYLGDSPELVVDTLGVICRQLPVAPVSTHRTEFDSMLWEVHDGWDVGESVNVAADVRDLLNGELEGNSE